MRGRFRERQLAFQQKLADIEEFKARSEAVFKQEELGERGRQAERADKAKRLEIRLGSDGRRYIVDTQSNTAIQVAETQADAAKSVAKTRLKSAAEVAGIQGETAKSVKQLERRAEAAERFAAEYKQQLEQAQQRIEQERMRADQAEKRADAAEAKNGSDSR